MPRNFLRRTAVLTVRRFGSHIVGFFCDFCGPWQATPGPTLLRPMPVGLACGLQEAQLDESLPQFGIGPREPPSQVSQPTAQPFENQKQLWPFW